MDVKQIESILNKSFEIECSEITLSQSDKIKYSGPGTITQNEIGEFLFRIFLNETPPQKEIFSLNNTAFKPGKIIDDDVYFSIIAKELSGDIWVAERVFKNFHGGPVNFIATGQIRKLTCVKPYKFKILRNSAKIIFAGDFDFPCNTATVVKKLVGDKERAWSGDRNISQFNACNFEFEIVKHNGYVSLELAAEDIPITEAFILQITETVRFLFAHSLDWSVLEITQNESQKIIIKPPLKEAKKSKIFPPISTDCNNNVHWLLFDKLLNHLLSLPEDSWTLFCYFLNSVIEAGLSTIEVEALVLCAAIEGILKNKFIDIAQPDEQFKSEVHALKIFLQNSNYSEKLKNRLSGMLASMLSPSAKDRLYVLESRNIIDHDLITAWNKTRNIFAHGDAPDYTDFQAFVDNRGAIIVLYYQLIFLAIGYQGQYCDYRTHGYPIKLFHEQFNKSE